LPPAFDAGSNAIMFYMMEEGMLFQGAVRVMGTPPHALNAAMAIYAICQE